VSVKALPPLVTAYEVRQFLANLDQAVQEGGFVLVLNPVCAVEALEFNARQVELRLLALMRLAAQATYWSGRRVVKVVDLGERWDPLDPIAGYLRTAAVANHLKGLSRSGFASLERIGEWAADGPPSSERYRESVEVIRRALRMMHAVQLPMSQRMTELDLWFQHKTSPFRTESSNVLLDGAGAYVGTGHLIELGPPAFEWGDQDSPLLRRSLSPLAVALTEANGEFVGKIIGSLGPGRHVVLKAANSDLAGEYVALVKTREGVALTAVLQIDSASDGRDIARQLRSLRNAGAAAIGLEVVLKADDPIDDAIDAAFEVIDYLYVHR